MLVQDEPVVKTEVLEEPKAEEENEEDVMNSDNSMAYDQLASGMQGTKGFLSLGKYVICECMLCLDVVYCIVE